MSKQQTNMQTPLHFRSVSAKMQMFILNKKSNKYLLLDIKIAQPDATVNENSQKQSQTTTFNP